MRTVATLLLLVVVSPIATAGDRKLERRLQIDVLIDALRSREYKRRESATRQLTTLGIEAVPQLLSVRYNVPNRAGLEQQRRIKAILAAIDWTTERLAAHLDGLERMVASRGKAKLAWDAGLPRPRYSLDALRQLIAIGKPAEAHLRRILQPRGGRLKLMVEAPRKVLARGQQIRVTARLVNQGPGAVWLPRRLSSLKVERFRFVRPYIDILTPGGRFGARRGGRMNLARRGSGARWDPLAPYQRVAAGASVLLERETVKAEDYGGIRVQYALKQPVRSAALKDPVGEELPMSLLLWSGERSDSVEIDVVPPLLPGKRGPVATGGLVLGLETRGEPTARHIRLNLKLRNTSRKPLRIWNPTAHGLLPVWYVILTPDHRVVRWGLADPRGAGYHKVQAAVLHSLPAGKEVATPLELPHKLARGEYLVLAGFGRFAQSGGRARGAFLGEATSNMVRVRIR